MARKRGKYGPEIKYSLLCFYSSKMLLNRTAANCGKPSFYGKNMPVTTDLQELRQCVLYASIQYHARLIVWSIRPQECSKHWGAKFSLGIMKSNFLLYHKIPRMPDYNSAESGTGRCYLQTGHSSA